MDVPGSSNKMIATQQEMNDARATEISAPTCSSLDKCRSAEFFLPWKCENERHAYDKCEYELVMERMLEMQKIRE